MTGNTLSPQTHARASKQAASRQSDTIRSDRRHEQDGEEGRIEEKGRYARLAAAADRRKRHDPARQASRDTRTTVERERTCLDADTPRQATERPRATQAPAVFIAPPTPDKQGGEMGGTMERPHESRTRARPPRNRDGRSKQTNKAGRETARHGRAGHSGTGHETSRAERGRDTGATRDEKQTPTGRSKPPHR